MHSHLDLYPNPHQIAKECNDRGMYVLSVTTTPKAWRGTQDLVKGYKRIRTSLGLHPQLVHERFEEIELFDHLLPKSPYIGEIGLDGTKHYQPNFQQQLKVFRHILKSINSHGGRIMSLHSAGATNVLLSELANHKSIGIPILHWFSGSKVELKKAIDRGCWFSIGPAMLATRRGKELIKHMPQNRLLAETDGPFARMKQEMVMPWDVNIVCKQLGRIWGYSLKEVVNLLDSNFSGLISQAGISSLSL